MIQYTIWMFLFEIRLIISFLFLYSIFHYCGIINRQLKSIIEKGASEGCYLPVTIKDVSLSLIEGQLKIFHLRIHSPPHDIDYRWKSDKVLDVDCICINFDIITLIQWLLVSRGHVLRIHNVDVEGMTFFIEGWEDPITGELFLNVSLIGIPPTNPLEYSQRNGNNITSSFNNSHSNVSSTRTSTSTAFSTQDINESGSSRSNNSFTNDSYLASFFYTTSSIFQSITDTTYTLTNASYWNDTINTIHTNFTHFSKQVLRNGLMRQVYTTASRRLHYSLKQKLAEIHESMSGLEPLPNDDDDIRIYGHKIEIRNVYLHLRNALPVTLRHLEKKKPLFVPYFELLLHNLSDRIIKPRNNNNNNNNVTNNNDSTTRPLNPSLSSRNFRRNNNSNNNDNNSVVPDNQNSINSSSCNISSISSNNTANNANNNSKSHNRSSTSRGVLGSLLRRGSGSPSGSNSIWRSVEREYVDDEEQLEDDYCNYYSGCNNGSDIIATTSSSHNNNSSSNIAEQDDEEEESGSNIATTTNNGCTTNVFSRSIFGLATLNNHHSNNNNNNNSNNNNNNDKERFESPSSSSPSSSSSSSIIHAASIQQNYYYYDGHYDEDDDDDDEGSHDSDTCWRDVDEEDEQETTATASGLDNTTTNTQNTNHHGNSDTAIATTASSSSYPHINTPTISIIRNNSNSSSTANLTAPSTPVPQSLSWSGYYHRYTAYELEYNIKNGIHSKILNYRFERALIGQVLKGNAGRLLYDALLDWTTLSTSSDTTSPPTTNTTSSSTNSIAAVAITAITPSSSSSSDSRSNSRISTPYQSPCRYGKVTSAATSSVIAVNNNNHSQVNNNNRIFCNNPTRGNSNIISSPLLSPLNQSHSRSLTTTTAVTATNDVDSEGSFFEGESVVIRNNINNNNKYDNHDDDDVTNDNGCWYDRRHPHDHDDDGGDDDDPPPCEYDDEEKEQMKINDDDDDDDNNNIFNAKLIDVNPIFFDPFSFNNNSSSSSNSNNNNHRHHHR